MDHDTLGFPVGPAWSFLAGSSSVLALRLDSAGTIVAANERATRLLGSRLLGQPWHTLLPHWDGKSTFGDFLTAPPRRRLLHVSADADWSQTFEIRVESLADGCLLFGEVNIAEQASVGRECREQTQDLNNLTRELGLQNAELELYRAHLEVMVSERTADLAQASKTFRDIHLAMGAAGICVLWVEAKTGRLIYVSERTAQMLGYSIDELLDLNVFDIDKELDSARFHQIIATIQERGCTQFESIMRSRDGRLIPVDVSLTYREGHADSDSHTIAFVTDISGRKAAERALLESRQAAQAAQLEEVERRRVQSEAKLQSRKLEAVGTLAAGIAHDFNNILGSIVGFAEMTLDDLADDSRAKSNIEQLLKASFRARDLIAHILAFARESPKVPLPVDVTAIVRESLALLHASLPTVELSFESGMGAGAPATLLVDPTQLQQIVMNLCINAAHAMSGHGLIRVRIDPAEHVKDVQLGMHLGVADPERPAYGGGICLSVADDGCGITPSVLERMFDPFFTTKAPGEGSGLGLSVVYGVVSHLGGFIEVKSRVDGDGRGTEFRVFLPRQKLAQPSEGPHGENIAH